jgi:hypothetical protein
MSEGKELIRQSTYFASEEWLGKLHADGAKMDGSAAIVNAPQLARMIDAALSYARRSELMEIRGQIVDSPSSDHARLIIDRRLHELEWGKPMPEPEHQKYTLRIVPPPKGSKERNQLIYAIKIVRVYSGWGPREAKDLIDAIAFGPDEGPLVEIGIDRLSDFRSEMEKIGYQVLFHHPDAHSKPDEDKGIFNVESPL